MQTYGYIKTAAATPKLKVADTAYNASQIIDMMQQAFAADVKLLVFPELSLTGVTCGDLFLHSTLLEGAKAALMQICKASEDHDTVIVVGAPLSVNNKLYNCAVVIQNGVVLGVIPKSFPGNSGDSYEARTFTPAKQNNSIINLCGQTVPFGRDILFGCTNQSGLIFGVEVGSDLFAPFSAACDMAKAGAALLVNPFSACEVVSAKQMRTAAVSVQSAKLLCGYVLAGAGMDESTTDGTFAGHRLIAEKGKVLADTPLYTEGLTIADIDIDKLKFHRRSSSLFETANEERFILVPFTLNENTKFELTNVIDAEPFIPAAGEGYDERLESILTMQAMGLRKRIEHTNAKTLVIGLSGGLDSTLALMIMVRAMDMLNRPRTDIVAVTMPCFGTTKRTKSNAQRQAESLGVTFKTVNIAAAVTRHLKDIGHDLEDHSVTFENAQARERTQVLMDIANKFGGMVVGTGDLSELALGFATYNGDHMSMYGVNGDVPKTLIRHLVAHEAKLAYDKKLKAALMDILATPVSPELLPAKDGKIAQRTEEIVGPYELHDFFLYHMIRNGFGPAKIYFLTKAAFADKFDNDTIKKWLRTFTWRFFSQQFKRSCLPDGPKVGSVALSPRGDWRMPSDAMSALWIAEIEKLED